ERVRIGPTASRETEDVQGEAAPAVDVAGLNLDVAQAFDVRHQIIARSGSAGSMPIEISAAAWETVLGTWIAWLSPTCASRQKRCKGLSIRAAFPPERAKIWSTAITARHAARIWVRRPMARSSNDTSRPDSTMSQIRSTFASNSWRAALMSEAASLIANNTYGSSLIAVPCAPTRPRW